ncbi:hypothetical protein EDB86DRAFT_2914254 [Lactarius hatsudake]|nr:hypothetical protein EDB86DRAFT_2914254 [Lactarius hatsudake]
MQLFILSHLNTITSWARALVFVSVLLTLVQARYHSSNCNRTHNDAQQSATNILESSPRTLSLHSRSSRKRQGLF